MKFNPGDVVRLGAAGPLLRTPGDHSTRVAWNDWRRGGDVCIVLGLIPGWALVLCGPRGMVGWYSRKDIIDVIISCEGALCNAATVDGTIRGRRGVNALARRDECKKETHTGQAATTHTVP